MKLAVIGYGSMGKMLTALFRQSVKAALPDVFDRVFAKNLAKHARLKNLLT